MRLKYLFGGLLASTVLSVAALAQSPALAPNRAPAPSVSATTAETIIHISQWRASKLIGVNVYNVQNEKLGDISDILLDQSGKVSGVVIGVGGFLGMGERDVLVGLDKLNFVKEPLPTTTGAAPGSATRDGPPSARPARSESERWYPDHAVMNATKDQLKAMPQFTYSDYN
jgi:sporulation protein YlmC with PRC-barrel domain